MRTKLDLTFEHDYEVDLEANLPSTPGEIKQLYYPGATEIGGRGGLLLKVSPHEGQSWIGIFATGYESPKSLTGVYSCPDSKTLCVISSGQGYLVQVNEPVVWSKILSYPIVDARPIYQNRLLVFVDYIKVSAYGVDGLKWITPRLSWDGIKIVEVTNKFIKGFAWDSPRDSEVEFSIDISTGTCKGGARPND